MRLKFAAFFLTFMSSSSFSQGILQFAGSEHVSAGDQVKIYFSAEDSGQLGTEFSLPNGLTLTYGQILSLGDFYGVVGNPISMGSSDADRRARFLGAYQTFAEDPKAVKELPQILDIIQSEKKAIDEGMKKGEKPEDIYARIADDNDRRFNCVTGGGCKGKVWFLKSGRYLKLAKKDYDHFNMNAWIAYQTGHQIALETAISAHATQDLQKLKTAYVLNAFACHFLSDRFASGHIRTPRVELPQNVTPSVVGSVLVSFMHKEENHLGLHMHNLRNDHWVAWGDQTYYDEKNKVNIGLMQEALQNSANEIFKAYNQGKAPADTVYNLLPIPDEINNKGNIDVAPLFYWDETSHTLYRRTDLANPQSRNWTARWLGWTTLIELERLHGLPAQAQAELVQAGYGAEAIQYGLIRDKDIWVIRKQE